MHVERSREVARRYRSLPVTSPSPITVPRLVLAVSRDNIREIASFEPRQSTRTAMAPSTMSRIGTCQNPSAENLLPRENQYFRCTGLTRSTGASTYHLRKPSREASGPFAAERKNVVMYKLLFIAGRSRASAGAVSIILFTFSVNGIAVTDHLMISSHVNHVNIAPHAPQVFKSRLGVRHPQRPSGLPVSTADNLKFRP